MASLAAEFPNDNPDLHEGVIWVCLDVTGGPSAERRAPETAPVVPIEAVEQAAAIEEVEEVEEEAPPTARPSGIFAIAQVDAPFEVELDAIDEPEDAIVVEEMTPFEDAAMEIVVAEAPAGADAETEPADDPFLVFVGAVAAVAEAEGSAELAARVRALLVDGRIDEDAPVEPSSVTIARAWQGILRNTSEDWDAIGGAMLDEWAADLLARMLGVAERAPMLKRELRARGIAGFGLAA